MLNYVPSKKYLRGILLHYFIQKTSTAIETHRILIKIYGEHVLSETICRNWFLRFKNNDFGPEDKERSGAPKSIKTKNWKNY